MRLIKKAPEPKELTEYRLSPNAKWDGDESFATVKQCIRDSLVREQGWLCCYCMCRIGPSAQAMNVEHWACRDRYEQRQLSWDNLLGVCSGDQHGYPGSHHCDRSKGNTDITVDPWNPAHMVSITYSDSGEVSSSDPAHDEDINKGLNLNTTNLKTQRSKAVHGFLSSLNKKYSGRKVSNETLARKLTRLANEQQLNPFFGAIEYWTKRRLQRT